ncbi:lycopene cyclase family protein [Pedobacter alpinus]|uniref:Lycopene cyclase family protein n=1 Tax=Pedobacter alpinus TaxID=1590643 RepID=A0ABW5TTR4_9SPHI
MQNKPVKFYNFTIVGAGASGLWMAYSLLKQGLLENKTLIIIENDKKKANDRTWCYWAKEKLTHHPLESKIWSYSQNASKHNKNGNLYPYNYYHIASNDFYTQIKAELNQSKNIYWLYSTYQSNFNGEVKTADGLWKTDKLFLSSVSKSQNIFNDNDLKSYLNNHSDKHILLWQSFIGWRIKTKKPVFDESKMTMMNFDIPQNGHTQFVYELPFTPQESLIELTRFSKEKLTIPEAQTILKDYLTKFNCEYNIQNIEIGAIPMTTHFDNKRKFISKDETVIYLGTIAGALKPTTGYGFKNMANYAQQLAFAISKNANLPTHHRKWRFKVYDILLLQILDQNPDRGKEIFQTLFKTQTTPKILRFLDEKTTIWEEISIFSKLPILLFLNSLLKYIFR